MEEKPTMPQTLAQEKCSKCNSPINLNYYFCPTCGKKLKEPPFKLYWVSVAGLTLFSFLLPPLGIFPGIKHLRIRDQKARMVGVLYIAVTIIATIIMIYIIFDYINNLNKMINEVNQIQSYY